MLGILPAEELPREPFLGQPIGGLLENYTETLYHQEIGHPCILKMLGLMDFLHLMICGQRPVEMIKGNRNYNYLEICF